MTYSRGPVVEKHCSTGPGYQVPTGWTVQGSNCSWGGDLLHPSSPALGPMQPPTSGTGRIQHILPRDVWNAVPDDNRKWAETSSTNRKFHYKDWVLNDDLYIIFPFQTAKVFRITSRRHICNFIIWSKHERILIILRIMYSYVNF
jgi:hypothetical protein